MKLVLMASFLISFIFIGQAFAQTISAPKVSAPATPQPAAGSALVPPLEEEELSDNFVYDITDKRDPFEPLLPKVAPPPAKEMAINPYAKEGDHTLEPLEGYELSQIRVLAIVWDTPNPKALLQDPTGATHYVKLKARIGKKNGFVVAIREGELVVVEYVEENGQYSKVFRVMELVR